MDINQRMTMFRLASRELFNHYFHSRVDSENPSDAEERFFAVQEELFRALVIWPEKLTDIPYTDPHPQIQVKLLSNLKSADWWQLGRQDPGVKLLSNYQIDRKSVCLPEAKLMFISFFDWNLLEIRENRYVRVFVESFPGYEHLNNTEALLEPDLVRFEKEA
jgi:hypothetical protein